MSFRRTLKRIGQALVLCLSLVGLVSLALVALGVKALRHPKVRRYSTGISTPTDPQSRVDYNPTTVLKQALSQWKKEWKPTPE